MHGWHLRDAQRVKAMGHAGALMTAVREAKRATLAPHTRVAQVRVTITPIPKRTTR